MKQNIILKKMKQNIILKMMKHNIFSKTMKQNIIFKIMKQNIILKIKKHNIISKIIIQKTENLNNLIGETEEPNKPVKKLDDKTNKKSKGVRN